MNPARVLDELGLLRSSLDSPHYKEYAQFFLDDVFKKKGVLFSDVDDREKKPNGERFCANLTRILGLSDSYFVSSEMATLCEFASQSLDETDQFARDLWPSDYGFLMFEKGLVRSDVQGRKLVIKAMAWGRSMTSNASAVGINGRLAGTMIVSFTDAYDERDEINQYLWTQRNAETMTKLGRLQVNHVYVVADGQRVGPAEFHPRDYPVYDAEDDTINGTTANDGRFLLAMLMMFSQTITEVVEADIDRPTARRAKRMGLPPRVTVVRLRRSKDYGRYEGETMVEWHHRWIVKGHWRNQPYGDGTVRRIWIAPYIKGPENKPLKQSEKVYALVR